MIKRSNLRRPRGIKIGVGHVITDGAGGIIEIPLHRIPCLGDPVEYYWGVSDRPWIQRDADGVEKEQAWGCALCPARSACGKVALERVETDAELPSLLKEWEQQTQRLTGDAVYEHASWTAFVLAARERFWKNSNEFELERRRAREAADRTARRSRERNLRNARARRVSKRERERVARDRDHLAATLIAIRPRPKAPRWIAKRTPERCEMMADVWQACEMIELSGTNVTAKAAIGWLRTEGRLPNHVPDGFGTRVNEIRGRLSDLLEQGLWAPSTPAEADVTTGAGVGLHDGLVWKILEDDVEQELTPSRSDSFATG